MDKNFTSVFEGLSKTLDTVGSELELLQKINAEQNEELRKTKRFNIVMFVIAILSFAATLISIVITIFMT